MITGIDDQTADVAYRSIIRLHVVSAAHLNFAHRDAVMSDPMRADSQAGDTAATHPHSAHTHGAHAKCEVRLRKHLSLLIAPVSARSRQELLLLGLIERRELGHRASEPDLLPGRCHEIDRDKMPAVAPMPRLHDEMSDRACDRIDDHASEIAADPVLAGDFASDVELARPAHRYRQSPGAPGSATLTAGLALLRVGAARR